MGDRLQNCRKGIEALSETGSGRILAQSRVYATEPVDYKDQDQDWFINLMVKLETAHDPFQLLDHIESIQRTAGRIQDPIRFGPRILDLDIILYDNRIIESERLIVPHPRMHKRRFVLKPICDIDPRLGEEEQKVFEYK
jgi:2-amino-4-hydroxy-6-hydroxymethyldihydropteridine diphosphokinase